MQAGLQALRHTSRACNSSLSLAAVEVMLGHVTYGGHVTNGLDLNAVKSMARWDATVQSRAVSLYFLCFVCCFPRFNHISVHIRILLITQALSVVNFVILRTLLLRPFVGSN